jgi:hypothetical protein
MTLGFTILYEKTIMHGQTNGRCKSCRAYYKAKLQNDNGGKVLKTRVRTAWRFVPDMTQPCTIQRFVMEVYETNEARSLQAETDNSVFTPCSTQTCRGLIHPFQGRQFWSDLTIKQLLFQHFCEMLCHVVCCPGNISSKEPTAFIFGIQNEISKSNVIEKSSWEADEKLMTDNLTTNVQSFHGPEDKNCI